MHTHRIHRIVLSLVAVAAFAGPLVGVAEAAAPVPPPSITPSGTQRQGTQLTLTQGTWDPAETGITDTWEQCDSGGASCATITPTGNSYTIPVDSTNLGKEIQVTETGTNPDTTTTTVTSDAVTVLPAPSNTGAPAISNTAPLQGNSLTASQGTWDNNPTTFAYEWDDCSGTPLTCTTSPTSTNSSSYTVTAADANTQIEVKVTATNADGSTSAPSTPTAAATGLPINTLAPAITGTPLQGVTLTASQGTWSNSPTTFAYEWDDCSGTPLTCTTSPTSTNSSSYTVTAADANTQIEVKVTATNGAGSTAAASTPTAAATGVPVGSGQPTITGPTWQGQTLTEGHGTATWTNTPTSYTYQWLRCNSNCAAIATGPSYVLTSADLGSTIEVSETGVNAAGSGAAALTSGPTAKITVPNTAAPGISGTPQQGIALTEVPGKWTLNPTIAIQWWQCDSSEANCVPVGTGNSSYTPTSTDVGGTIQVSETATNPANNPGADPVTVYSGFVGPVADAAGNHPPPALSGSAPTVSGSPLFGHTLSSAGAQFSGNPATFSYQWLRCDSQTCSPIPGATGPTYTPTGADVGDTVAFSETATNSNGTSSAVVSTHTDTITAPSTIGLQASSATPTAGQGVTLIASVSSPAGAAVKLTGTVAFDADGAPISGCGSLPLNGSAAPTAVCQTSFHASTPKITAVYSPTPSIFVNGSSSSPTTLTVGRAATTLTVSPSGHVSLGSRTTYTAVVHPPASSLTPSGRVTFTDGGKTIKGCRNRALTAKRASCSVKYVGIKAHRISARYTGDANFAPSASITSHVLVQPQTPKGFVTVYMNWTFGFGPHSTTIKGLSASGISPGIGISLTCSGSGCPFKHHTLVVKARGKCAAGAKKKCAAPSSIDLTPIFGRAQLRVGASFTVAITHSNWVGKYYRFTIRAGHRPSIAESCLAVNGTRPGVGCRAS